MERRSRKRKTKEKRTTTTSDRREPIGRTVAKYWHQRYSLFSRYDEGIAMDEEGWFSVTPEAVAARHAELCGGAAAVVVDGFAGVGGNAIQFAKRGCHVVAVEIDSNRLNLARRNAEIYGVRDRIDFVAGDFLRLAPFLKGDVVFLSPPWGGPGYKAIGDFTLDMLKPEDGYSIFQISQRITPNIIMFLPRTMNRSQVEELAWLSSPPLDFAVIIFIYVSFQSNSFSRLRSHSTRRRSKRTSWTIISKASLHILEILRLCRGKLTHLVMRISASPCAARKTWPCRGPFGWRRDRRTTPRGRG